MSLSNFIEIASVITGLSEEELIDGALSKVSMTGVYLLHFEPKFRHAGHYLGYADDIGRRVLEHQEGKSGAKLPAAAAAAGSKLILARTWEGEDRNFERKLKGRQLRPDGTKTHHRGSLKQFCPICKAQERDAKALVRGNLAGSPERQFTVSTTQPGEGPDNTGPSV
jgi:predicted GIY-YIG superfamily endonuclease